MSTKIHYGIQLRARDLRQVLDEFNPVLEKAEAILVKRRAAFLAVTAASRLDRAALFGLSGYSKPWALNGHSAISSAWDEMDDRQTEIRRTRMRDPQVDFEVVYRLWLSRDTGTFIGYIRAEGADDFRQLLFDAGIADEFVYWNNTDPEDGFTDEQWAARGEIWKGVLAGKSGPWFDILVPDPIGGWGVSPEIMAALPSLDYRVRVHSESVAFNSWAEAKVARHVESGLPNVQDVMIRYFDFYDKLRDGDPEVTALHEQALEQVKSRLVPVITEAMLTARDLP